MAVHFIDINNKEIVKFANKLEKMKRSDFPVTVRETLNNMAFDVKKNTLPLMTKKKFVLRNKIFFKRFSGVEKAKGFNVDSMFSEVGIVPRQNIAARELEKQELGGRLKKRSFIYMKGARVGRSDARQVRRVNYLSNKRMVQGRPNKRRSKKSQFIADAIIAERTNKFMLRNTRSGMTAFIVNKVKLSGNGNNRKAFVKTEAIASYEKGRDVSVRARPFIKPASLISAKKGNDFFIKQFEKRIKKAI